MQFRAAHKTHTVNPTQATTKNNIKKEHPRPSQIPKYSKSNKTSCRQSRESIIMFFGPGIRIESFVLQCYGIQITKFITVEKCHLVLCVLQNYQMLALYIQQQSIYPTPSSFVIRNYQLNRCWHYMSSTNIIMYILGLFSLI